MELPIPNLGGNKPAFTYAVVGYRLKSQPFRHESTAVFIAAIAAQCLPGKEFSVMRLPDGKELSRLVYGLTIDCLGLRFAKVMEQATFQIDQIAKKLVGEFKSPFFYKGPT